MKNLITILLMLAALAGFSQKAINYWDGSFNSYWHNDNNWSLGHIPTSTEDVVIPNGMPRYPAVDFYNESIKSLVIQSGAYVLVKAYTLTVSGDIQVYGLIDMDHTDARIYCNNITWLSGSQAETTGDCEFFVYGTWEFAAGANVQLDNGRVKFQGSGNQYIRSKDADCYFNNVYPVKTGGLFGLSSQSTATCKIKGYFILGGSNYDFTSPSTQTIQIGHYFNNANTSINIVLANGTIEFTGNTGNCSFYPQPGDYFNNLTINTGSYDLVMSTFNTTSFEIKGDVTISSGRFDVGDMDLIVGGNWTNNVGSYGFWERDQKVTFNGSDHQYCSDETFHNLEINKSSGALRMNGTDVVCAAYDWTAGAVDVLSGSFTANDLLDNAIQGAFYLNAGGTINLHNPGGYIDLKGDLFIYGGEFNVYGGSLPSYWPYNEDASITMSDGVLDIKDQGIQISNTAYVLNDNITGGRIKCVGYLYNDRADFTPNAGGFEMYGPTNANVRCSNGGRFWDLVIDKVDGGKDAGVKPFTDRDGTYYDGSKGNSANAVSNIECYSHLYIDGGTFDLGTYDFSTTGSALIYGTLKMNSASNDFSVGWDIQWRTGSTADVTAGNFHVDRHWYFESGTNAQIGPGNTLRFSGDALQFFYSYDGDAEIGNFIVENTASSAWLHSSSTQIMHVRGDMTVNSGAEFRVQDKDLVVEGMLDIANGAYMSTYDGWVETNSDFVLNGELEVGEGGVLVHGTFDLAYTGVLTIDGGYFLYDEGNGECNLYGTFNLSNGSFIAHEVIVVMSSADMNMSGGVMRSHAFRADYANTFQPDGGTFECDLDEPAFGTLRLNASNYFHNLKINSSPAYSGGLLKSDILINNDLIVSSGALKFNGFTATVGNDADIFGQLIMDGIDDLLIVENDIFWKWGSTSNSITSGEIQVYGNWTFENGTNAQLGAGNTVHFNGTATQFIYCKDPDARLGSLSIDNTSSVVWMHSTSTQPLHVAGSMIVPSGAVFQIQGKSLVVDGDLDIQDGATMYLSSSGGGQLTNNADMELNGELIVGSGEALINGMFDLMATGTLSINGGSFVNNGSDITNANFINGELNMSGGLYQAEERVYIASTATTNITGGTIKCRGFIAADALNFQPTGGTVELRGFTDYAVNVIECTAGNHFHNLEINAASNSGAQPGSDITVQNNLTITSGTLYMSEYEATVQNKVDVYGMLNMSLPGAAISCYEFTWHPGSGGLVNSGDIYCFVWTFEDGTNAMLEPGNTAHVMGIYNYDPDAEFGHLIWEDWTAKRSNNVSANLKSTEIHDLNVEKYTSETKSKNPITGPLENGKTSYPRKVSGNCSWLGSGWFHWGDIIVQGTADITDGSSVQLGNMVTLTTYSDFSLNGELILADGNCFVDGDFEIAATGELIIEGGEFIVESNSVTFNSVYGTMTMTDGLFGIDRNLKFQSGAVSNISGGMIRCTGFFAPYANTFKPTGGVVESQVTSGGQSGIECSNGNYFYNFNLNPISGGVHIMSDILISNDLNIYNGYFNFDGFTTSVHGNTTIHDGELKMEDPSDVLNAGDDPSDEIIWKSDASLYSNNQGRINIFGDCTIEDGVTYNVEADQTFAFVGTLNQVFNNLDDATFGTIELAKPSGALIIPSGSIVECQSYDWTAGTLTVQGGNFTAIDLADYIVEGTINLQGGLLDFTQNPTQNLAVEGHLNISDGTFNLRGGAWDCKLAMTDALFLTMSGGTLDFIDNGVDISSTLLVMNMTGGTIRTNENFKNINPGFLCDGGTVELYGFDKTLSSTAGYFHDLLIEGVYTCSTDLNIHGDFYPYNLLTFEGNQITCMGDVELYYGELILTEGSTLRLNNNSSLNVKFFSYFRSLGTESETNLVTGINPGDRYNFTVESNAGIEASHTIFENMSANGIYISEGAGFLDEVFHGCTFRNGQEGGTLLTLNSTYSADIIGAVFENSAEGAAYNVTKTNDQGEFTFIDYAGNFAGQSFENDPNNRIHWFEPELAVSPSNRDVGAAAGTTTFNVTSNTDWTVTDGFDWIDVLPMSGTGNGTLTVNYDENTSVISRMASITVSGDGVSDVIVTVIQAGANPTLAVSPENQNVSATAGGTSFDVFSNTSWSVSESVDWLTVAPMSGSGNETLGVSYDENLSVNPRIGEITITAAGLTYVVVTVTQAGVDPILTVTPPERWVGPTAGMVTFSLVSNTSWSVSESVDWLSVSPMNGANNQLLEVTYDENTLTGIRVGEITVSAAGVSDVVIIVNQVGVDLILTVTPANQNVGAAAGNTTFNIESNTSWNVTETNDWLSVNPATGSGDAVLDVSYQQNNTGSPRVGEITVTTDGKLSVLVTVTQDGEFPTLAVDPEFFDFLAPNGIAMLDVYSNTNWLISDDMDWLGLNYEIPSGNQMVQVSVQMNNTGVVRTGEITVETEDGSVVIIIPVTQQPFVEHTISIPAGWSGMSSYALPTPPFVEDVFSGIMDELVIALTEEGIFYPEYSVNTIGMWEPFSAYKIKTNAAVDLEIYGSAYPSKTMSIPAGWSLLPVVSECDVDVEALMAAVVDEVIIIKDIAGYGVYWPEMNINTIGALQPGSAYYILTNCEIEITFPSCSKTNARSQPQSFDFSNLMWPEPQKTTSSHSIFIHPYALSGLEAGSLLGAFDQSGNCFGITIIRDSSNYITLFGDDPTTAEKDGFFEGEMILFQNLSGLKDLTGLNPTFDPQLPSADGLFTENGLSAITGFEAATGIGYDVFGSSISIYPNPTNGVVNITGLGSETKITVTDVRGQVVFSTEPLNSGLFSFDLSGSNPGVYFISIQHSKQSIFRKIILR